jgi:hypothetical protein
MFHDGLFLTQALLWVFIACVLLCAPHDRVGYERGVRFSSVQATEPHESDCCPITEVRSSALLFREILLVCRFVTRVPITWIAGSFIGRAERPLDALPFSSITPAILPGCMSQTGVNP